MDGKTVPMILRWERGVINRFMYSILMLSPSSQTATPDLSAWNRKALWSFSGGVAIGHTQGAASGGDMRYLAGLRMGYAVLYSSGNRTNTHYNLQLGGETAIMVKDRFVSAYAEPEYTIAVGGSGGAIQQYVYGQNHPGLLDGGVPQYSYSDMVTQTIHVGDCELLERWLDSKVLANPLSMWRTWVNRTLIEGLSTSATFPNPYAAVMPYMPVPGSTECINGWRGLSPLALNPNFGTAPGYNPAVHGPVEWTHWGDLVNIYGTDETGFARSPWDNVGVQYGLEALQAASITPEQFLDLNANVGSWKASKDMVQEGCPFIAAALRHAGARRVERPQHEPLARRRRHAGRAARGEPGGGLCRLPLGDGLPGQARHPGDRLAPLPRAPARHAQLAPVVRLAAAAAELRRRRVEPADLVHRRAAGHAAVRSDAAGVPRPRSPGSRTSRRTRRRASARTSRPTRRTPASRRTAA